METHDTMHMLPTRLGIDAMRQTIQLLMVRQSDEVTSIRCGVITHKTQQNVLRGLGTTQNVQSSELQLNTSGN